MILALLSLLLVMGLFVLFDWRALRQGNFLTRCLYIALFGISALIWLYLNEASHVFFPDVWVLEQVSRFFG